MTDLRSLSTADLRSYRVQANQRYDGFRSQKQSLNLGRGKPSPEQLDLSNDLLSVLGPGDFLAADGTDCRNYGGLQGLPEARALFGAMLEIAGGPGPGRRQLVARVDARHGGMGVAARRAWKHRAVVGQRSGDVSLPGPRL